MIRPRLTRRGALKGLAAAAAARGLGQPASAAEPEGLAFLAVGDWGRDGAFHQREVAAQMGLTAEDVRARFVISVGDNFYDDGVAGVDDPKWRSSFEDVYVARSLQAPWYVALGNHDYHGSAQAQVDYTARSARWRMPARWYSRREQAPDGATLELFVLDTSPFIRAYADGAENLRLEGQDPALQLAWLDAALAASRAQWKIVVGHHPIWAGGHGGMAELQAALDPRLHRHGVQLYLNGHNHDLQHLQRDAVHYVCTGAGSRMDASCELEGSDFCSVRPGFVLASVRRTEIRLAYRDHTGATLKVVDIRAGEALG